MRHRVAGRKLSRSTGHRRALYRNLVTDLLRYEKIVTTEGQGQRSAVCGREDDHPGKEGVAACSSPGAGFCVGQGRCGEGVVVEKVFDDIGPRYEERQGGYTRILRLGPRLGDGAPMVQLELV